MMKSPPPNPFSGNDGDNHRGDATNFDAFALAPVTADTAQPSVPMTMPSLHSIHQQEQMQQQQPPPAIYPRGGGGGMQQPKSDEYGLPSPEEMSGPMVGGGGGSGSDNSWPPPPPSNSQQNSANNNNNNSNQSQSFLTKLFTCGGLCSVEALRPYFDVDTADVVVRVKGSLRYCLVDNGFRQEVLYSDNALRSADRNSDGGGGDDGAGVVAAAGASPDPPSAGKGPDLYGPVWIALTLVFCVAVTSNMSLYVHHRHRGSLVGAGGTAAEEEWDYDINQLLRATWILYSFSFGLPAALCFALGLTAGGGGGHGLGLADLVCLYGYSLVPFLPASWLCVVPYGWVKWLVLLAATVASGMLVLRNVVGPIVESVGGGSGTGFIGAMQGKSAGLIVSVAVCHFVFFFVMKLAFYHHS